GSVGKYHQLLDQAIEVLPDPVAFLAFDQPDYQKLAMSFRVDEHPVGNELAHCYRLTLEHRTHALSPAARRHFALYWVAIKPGGNFVSWLLLRAIKRRAEADAVRQDQVYHANSEGDL
ncbi:MAG: hypothetical protein KF832_16355, partial [Caldilineaceae bacterium]|nr:hypothetical protein [Caldilineaceae bacterium]